MNRAVLIIAPVVVLLLAMASAYIISTRQQKAVDAQTNELKLSLAKIQGQLECAQNDLASLRTDMKSRDAENSSLKAQMQHLEEQLAEVKKKATAGPFMAFGDKDAEQALPKLLEGVMKLADAAGEAEVIEEEIDAKDLEALEEHAARELELGQKEEMPKELAAERMEEIKKRLAKNKELLERVRKKAGPEVADMVEKALKQGHNRKGKTTHRVFTLPGGGQGHVVIKVDGMGFGEGKKPPKEPEPVKEDF